MKMQFATFETFKINLFLKQFQFRADYKIPRSKLTRPQYNMVKKKFFFYRYPVLTYLVVK